MYSTLLPDGDAIDRWAGDVSAPALVPLLVRMLISQTTDPSWIDVPAGRATRFPGWDGEVKVPKGNPWVPRGLSLWEIGTDDRITKKANDDYKKRTDATPEAERMRATFVFATPRSWGYRKAWLKAKKKVNEWRDVRAIDAEGLAAWAATVQYVHIWLSHQIDGKAPGAEPLDLWWDRWSQRSHPHPIDPPFMLRGRTDQAARVLEWAAGPARRLILDSTPPDDGVAFIGAALKAASAALDTQLMRAVVIDGNAVWDELLHHRKPMIMISRDEGVNVPRAIGKGHHVLIVASPDDPGAPGDIALADLARDEMVAGLERLGLDPKIATRLVDDADGDLKTIRRRLSRTPEFTRPSWSVGEGGTELLAAVLAGSWDSAVPGDRDAISAFAGSAYGEVEATLTRLSDLEDPPVRRRGTTWLLSNRRDAWRLTAPRMDEETLGRFSLAAQAVLGARDPALDLPTDERWMANVQGKARRHGARLRLGIATTVAMLAGWRHLAQVAGGEGPRVAAGVAASLLAGVNDDPFGGGWMSLGDVLPLLAEAAPEPFMAAVEAGLDSDPSPLAALLDTGADAGAFSRSYQAPALWALESLAWAPGYLPRVTRSLVRWSALDPGGKWANRPAATFRVIFLPWFPQTAAGVEARIEALESVAADPAAWPLLRSLLRVPMDNSMPSHRPDWRTWAPVDRPPASDADRTAVESAVVRLLLEHVDSIGARWVDLLAAYTNALEPDREAIAAALSRVETASLAEGDRELIWRKLEETIGEHRAFRGRAVWALPEKALMPLIAAVDRFAPVDPVAQIAWLFGRHPETELVTGSTDFTRYEEMLVDRRAEALDRAIRDGWEAVERLVARSEHPFAVGFALGRGAPVEERPLDWGTGTAPQIEALRGFLAGAVSSAGWPWVGLQIQEHLPVWGADTTAGAILSTHRRPEGWELAARLGHDVEAAYWAGFWGYWKGEDVWIAVAKLLDFGHPYSALDLITAQLDDDAFDVALAQRALLDAAAREPRGSHDASMLQAYLPQILDRLEAGGVAEGDLARLEWTYLAVLEHSDSPATRLGGLLAADPAFFVEVLSLVYRADGESPRVLGPEEERAAAQARRLLSMWKTPPGTLGDGIDPAALRVWVAEARRLAAEVGRGRIADFKLGQALWWAPEGSDGLRPAPAVRDLIESLASEMLEEGFANEAMNSRGVVWRAKGGDQERELAAGHQVLATALRPQWPRTASIFDGLAASYLREAEMWDVEQAIDDADEADGA